MSGHLAWDWAHPVKYSVKTCRTDGSRPLLCRGHQPRELALSTHNKNNGAMMPLLKGGVELGVSERCHVLAAAPGP